MKRIILLTFLFITCTLAAETCNAAVAEKKEAMIQAINGCPAPDNVKIQVAILLDTSGSMEGLIEQAKSRLWNIVNTLTALKFKGTTPDVQIALYEYGSYKLYNGDYIRQIVPLTTDLDLISQELFVLTAGGSEEYCGTVIDKATRQLEWGSNEADMKLIYIAGNETFKQGVIFYKDAIGRALKKNIYVNTIHCGNQMIGIRHLWRDAAEFGKGKFFNIDSNAKIYYVETPFDEMINCYNSELNNTYVSYGQAGIVRKVNQTVQDENAKSISLANYAERAVSKSKAIYQNASWDLVDKIKEDKDILLKIKKEDLPEELQGKSIEELNKFISDKSKKRADIRKKIAELAIKRQLYLDEQSAKNNEMGNDTEDLGKAIHESILAFAQDKGYTF